MKKLIIPLLVVLILPSLVLAQRPIVYWEPSAQSRMASLFPGVLMPSPGDKIQMSGRVCAMTGGGTFNGQLKYQVWGFSSVDKCKVVCGWESGDCYDYEVCGGQACGVICVDSCTQSNLCPGGQQKCGDYPCPDTCGANCDTMKDEQYSSALTVLPGDCSAQIMFETPIDETWDDGWHVSNLFVVFGNDEMDVEWGHFKVVKDPIIDVELLTFVIISVGAMAGAMITKGLGLW